MRLYEVMDEQERTQRIYFTTEAPNGVNKTHTLSYKAARDTYQELGDVMGLEKKIEEAGQ